MATIKINSVTFDPAPTGPVDVILKYKVHTDTVWIDLNGGIPIHVPLNGVLSIPFDITGLDNGVQYDISAQTTCGSEATVIQITTPSDSCPNIEDIDFIVIN